MDYFSFAYLNGPVDLGFGLFSMIYGNEFCKRGLTHGLTGTYRWNKFHSFLLADFNLPCGNDVYYLGIYLGKGVEWVLLLPFG